MVYITYNIAYLNIYKQYKHSVLCIKMKGNKKTLVHTGKL